MKTFAASNGNLLRQNPKDVKENGATKNVSRTNLGEIYAQLSISLKYPMEPYFGKRVVD